MAWHRIRLGRHSLRWEARRSFRLRAKRAGHGRHVVTVLQVGPLVATWYRPLQWKDHP